MGCNASKQIAPSRYVWMEYVENEEKKQDKFEINVEIKK